MGGVQTREIEVTFDGGIDQFTEERHLQPPALIDCVNLIPYNNGSLRRRFGSDAISPTAQQGTIYQAGGYNIAAWRRAYSFKDYVLAHDGDTLYSYNNSYPSSSKTGWYGIDRVEPVVARRGQTVASNKQPTGIDIGYVYPSTSSLQSGAKGFLVIAHTMMDSAAIGAVEYEQVFVTVKDLTTGTYIYNSYKLSTNAALTYNDVKVAVSGDNVIVTYVQNTTLYGRVMSILTPGTWGAETNIATLGSVEGVYDICGDRTQTISTEFGLIYESAVVGNRVTYARLNVVAGAPNVLQTSNRADTAAFATLRGVAIKYGLYPGPGTIPSLYVAFTVETVTPDGEVWMHAVSATNVGTDRRPVAQIVNGLPAPYIYSKVGIETYSSGNGMFVVVSRDVDNSGLVAAFGPDLSWYTCDVPSATASANFGVIPKGVLSGKPFTYANRIYFQHVHRQHTGSDGTLHAVTCLTDSVYAEDQTTTTNGLPAATVAPRITSFNHLSRPGAANIVATDESDVFYGVTATTDLESGGWCTVQYDFSYDNNAMQSATLADTIYFSGGVPTYYDGKLLNEVGFYCVPHITNVQSGAPGSFASGSTYLFTCLFQQYDGAGDLHVSPTCVPFSFTQTTGAGTTAILTSVYLNGYTRRQRRLLTDRPRMDIGVYITQAGGTTYTQKEVVGPNLPQQIDFTRTPYASTASTAAKALYTTGGGLDAVIPPCFTAICTHKNRIWGIGDDERTVWFSTQKRERVAPFFNEVLTFRIDDDGLPLTALGSLDDNLIIFKSNKIYYVSGDGPNENGTGSTLSSPQFVNTDVGCDNPRSVVRVPNGIVFSGAGSIYMLSRGLTLSNIGKRVQTILTNFPVISSVHVSSSSNQVRFCCNQTNSNSSGVILCYDYELDRWYKHTYYPRGNSDTVAAHGSAVDSQGRQWLMFWDGKCVRENFTIYRDAGSSYETPDAYVQTAHLQAAGKNGFMRVQKVGAMYAQLGTDNNLRFDIKQNFGIAFQQNKTFSSATITSLNQENIQVHLTKPECQAISVKLTQQIGSTPTSYQGLSFIGLVFTVGTEGGQFRVAPSAQG